MPHYCHICGRTVYKDNRKSFSRDALVAYMSSNDRVSQHDTSNFCCRSCAIYFETWRREESNQQYRLPTDTSSEDSASQSSVSQASSHSISSSASSHSVLSAASSHSVLSAASSNEDLFAPGPSRRKRNRSDLANLRSMPPMAEEVEDAVPTFHSTRFSRLYPRRGCFLGCDWTRSTDLRLLTTDERFYLLQQQNTYAEHETYVCKSHVNPTRPNEERMINPELLTNEFTVAAFEDALTLSVTASVNKPFRDGVPVPDDRCKRWTGLSYGNFSDMSSNITIRGTKKSMLPLAVYLAKLRTGNSIDRIADTLYLPISTAKNYMVLAREASLDQFVPQNLGFSHIDRETALTHLTDISKALFNIEEEDADKIVVVADGTYIYHQKSFHHKFQRDSYSPHKYTHLFKPMMIVCTDGYILDVKGPYSAKSNDASIFEDIIRANDFSNFFTRGDIFILDRGFRNCLNSLTRKGYRHRSPEFSAPNQQLTVLQANRSRMVTKVRWIVEDINGKIKSKFRAFDKVWPNTALDHAFDDFRIACAILNKYGKRFDSGKDSQRLANLMLQRYNRPNQLIDFVQGFERWNSRNWQTIDAHVLSEFPKYCVEDLFMITLGPYQLKMAEGYFLEHSSVDGSFYIQVQRDATSISEKADSLSMEDPILIRARIQSRHSNATKYIVLICFDRCNRTKILHYCQCKNGARTVGCCAHSATLVWYLGWARYKKDLHLPSVPMRLLETHHWTDEDE